MAQTRPTARPAAKPAAKPADDFDFGDDTGFEGFEESTGEADPEFGEFDTAEGGDDFDGFGPDEDGVAAPSGEDDGFEFEEGATEGDDGFGDADGFADETEPEAEPEAELPAPKLADGNYVIPKGTPTFYVAGDDDGNWTKSVKVDEVASANIKVKFDSSIHNNSVVGLEDKPGKTFVVLGFKKDYFVVTIAEKLLDAKGKPAQILSAEEPEPEVVAAPAKPAKAEKKAEKKAAAAEPTYSPAQIKSVRMLRATLAAIEEAFPGI
jgi:hypothetical protein